MIKIGSLTEYLTIDEIHPEMGVLKNDSVLNHEFLNATVRIKIEGFSSNLRITVLLGELLDLRKNLQKLYEDLKSGFVFSNLEENIKIEFKPTENGQIEICGFLRNSYYTGKLEFNILTDQSYLPEAIRKLNQVLK